MSKKTICIRTRNVVSHNDDFTLYTTIINGPATLIGRDVVLHLSKADVLAIRNQIPLLHLERTPPANCPCATCLVEKQIAKNRKDGEE